MKIAKMLLSIIFVLTQFNSFHTVNALQAYGDNTYGDCKYSEGCEASTESTIVPVPPSTDNLADGRVFSVNIKTGQIFKDSSYQVRVTPNFPPEQIDRVVLFQNGIEVGYSTEVSGESYLISWKVPQAGDYNLSIKVYLKDGKTIENSFDISTVKDTEVSSNITEASKTAGEKARDASGFIQSTIDAFKRLIASVPAPIAYLMPYGLISAIGLLLLALLVQTKNQLKYISAMIALLKKDKLLFDEKATFIKLVSHHIRTPMTILSGGVEAYGFENPKAQIGSVVAAVHLLSVESEQLLSEAQQNKQLQKISQPDIKKTARSLYKSWKLVLPALLSLALIFLLNYVFINAGQTQLIISNIVVQVIIMLSLSVGILVLLQRRQNNMIEQGYINKQHRYQLELDKARNSFIKQAANKITPLLIATIEACQKSIPSRERKSIDEATSRLGSLLERFNFASELEKGKIEAAFADIQIEFLLQSALGAKKPDIAAKNLKISISGGQTKLVQNEYLLLYVLFALADNAVNYADKNTKIDAAVKHLQNNQVDISIKDQGLAIDKDKIESLFKPFSRSDNVVQFDKQGAGINLYLARLISRYLGGDVVLNYSSNNQTVAVVRLPDRSSV